MKSSRSPLDSFFAELKTRGFRLTELRRELAGLFMAAVKPLTIVEVQSLLGEKAHHPNLTSIYREIGFLMERGFLRSVQIADNKAHYEFVGDHHHHIVCRACGKIEDVDFPELEKIFPLIEKKLKRLKTFRSLDHSLEFFGLCEPCGNQRAAT